MQQKRRRAQRIFHALEKLYPAAGIELKYKTQIQLLAAVMLSAQCTDKKVNEVTASLFKKYKTVDDFTDANLKTLEQEIRPTGFYRIKARNIIAAAKIIREDFDGRLPKTMDDMLCLPGVARKTANVVLGNAYGVVEGIAVDTHVKRLAKRFNLARSDDPTKIERELMEIFPKSQWFKLTYLFIKHGRTVCKAIDHRSCEKLSYTALRHKTQ